MAVPLGRKRLTPGLPRATCNGERRHTPTLLKFSADGGCHRAAYLAGMLFVTAQDLWGREENKRKQNNLPLWPSPRTTENTQAARRNGAGPGLQFCRQTNVAVKKARAERHIMQSRPHCTAPAAWLLTGCALALPGAKCQVLLGRFQQARQAGPAARSKRCRYGGLSTARHFRAPAALPAPHGWSRDLREKHLLWRPKARGGDASKGSAARSGTKKRAFVSLQPMGLLLHKSA